MFHDPTKQHIPLYVLTFIGPAPKSIKLSYMSYQIDKYYPTPLQCRKCYRLGHSTATCKSKPLCSICSSPDHEKKDCKNEPKCVNCRNPHASTSHDCPKYQKEKDICYVTAEKGVSFSEARKIVENDLREKISQEYYSPVNIDSRQNFPELPQRNLSKNPEYQTRQVSMTNRQKTIIPETQDSVTATQNLYDQNTILFDSQGIDYIWPGQQIRPTQLQDSQFSPLQLPYLSPPSQIASQTSSSMSLNTREQPLERQRTDYNWYNTQTDSQHQTNTKDTRKQTQNSLINELPPLNILLPKLIPLLISLIFASTTSDRIEIFSKIGQLLNLDNVVTATLASIQIS